ncbi:hypothetical protein BDV96DRAFT_248428 [Lophiotrema nucula]|uniref:Uncharacterized protein n=1 Tax=Lophiotrema nucula TaxID=690887 RepID=A0A6A5YQN6_9PLEO|nr:hypothetical protein BDV96DRAFT_248428 [Lophiotrema nucula]
MKRTLAAEGLQHLDNLSVKEQERTLTSKRPKCETTLQTPSFFNIPQELRDRIYHYLWLDPPTRTVPLPTLTPTVHLGSIYISENRLRYTVTACYEGTQQNPYSQADPSWLLTNKQMLREGLGLLTFNSVIGLNWSPPSSAKRKRRRVPEFKNRVSPQVGLSTVEALEIGPLKLKLDYRNHPKGRKIDGRMGYRDTVAIDDHELPYLDALGTSLQKKNKLRYLKICFRLPQPSGQRRMRMPPRTRPAVDSPTRTRLEVDFDRIPFLEHVRTELKSLEITVSSVVSQDGYKNEFWPVLNRALQEGALNIGKTIFGEDCSIERRDVGAVHWERGDPSNMWNYIFSRSP